MNRTDPGRRAFWAIVVLSAGVVAAVLSVSCCIPMILAGPADAFTTAPAMALAAITVGLGVHGVIAAVRVVRASRRLRHDLASQAVPAPAHVRLAAAAAGLDDRVDVVAARQPYAITFGALTPRVAVSTGLLNVLTERELDAVLAHESVHVRRRDPLKTAVTKIVAPRRLFGPVVRALQGRFLIGSELAADRKAIERHGRRPLAGALLKVVDMPAHRTSAAAAMAEPRALDARLTQMETGEATGLPSPSIAAWIGGLAGAAVLTWAVAGTAALVHLVCPC